MGRSRHAPVPAAPVGDAPLALPYAQLALAGCGLEIEGGTDIAWPSPTKQGKEESHGAKLGAEEVAGLKKALGLDPEATFQMAGVLEHTREHAAARARAARAASASLSAEELALREAALSTPKPQRPEGMDEFTPEGAVATAEYFLNLAPYIYATGNLEPWQAISDPDCGMCNNGTNEVTHLHQAGGWWDPWQQELTVTGYGPSTGDSTIWVVAVTASYTGSTKHDGAGGTSPIMQAEDNLYIQVHWTGQSWTVEAGQTL